MKKGPIENERVFQTLAVVLREFFVEYTDVCPVASEVAKISDLPEAVIDGHLRELELRRVLVNRPLRSGPQKTYWLNDYQLRRFAKQAPPELRSLFSRYFRTFIKVAS